MFLAKKNIAFSDSLKQTTKDNETVEVTINTAKHAFIPVLDEHKNIVAVIVLKYLSENESEDTNNDILKESLIEVQRVSKVLTDAFNIIQKETYDHQNSLEILGNYPNA